MAELAVKGCVLTVTPVTITVAGKQITTPPSTDSAVGDNGIYFGDIQVALSGITQGNYAYAGGTLVVTISGTAENILELEGDKPAVQKGDSGEQKKVTLTDSSSGSTISVDIKVEVTDAGQSDVVAL